MYIGNYLEKLTAGFEHVYGEPFLWGVLWGLGQTSKSRPQVLIDSTMVLVVDSNVLFDTAQIRVEYITALDI